ncbi:MAG: 3-phosphoshikimate 1-carboxyvinyltransferase [Propionibacteriaceae bacterium]|nr:3-phosphoshikimate 1-carboxyvinyltransferase [Propionibacteriaceae bacterium]
MSSWVAPQATHPIQATIDVPGSKSATARALVLAALGDTPSTIRGGLRARDSSLMIEGLSALGAIIDDHNPQVWTISPIASDRQSPEIVIQCGLAGTVMRFLPPVAALGAQKVMFTGDDQARHRPVAPLLNAMSQLGAQVEGSALPFSVCGPITSRDVLIDSSSSSQFVSALLLSGAQFPQGLRLTHQGDSLPSLPHIEMTMESLSRHGVDVTWARKSNTLTWEVPATSIGGCDETIEPDLTTAAVFLAAAVITQGVVRIPRWPSHTTQAGAQFLDILARFGAQVNVEDGYAQVCGVGEIHGIDINLNTCSELTPVVAALATLANSETRIRGVGHIRGHETDRLAGLSTEIARLSGVCTPTEDGLIITPAQLKGGKIRSYADHRMAHFGALIGLRVPDIRLDDVTCTSKTMPDFAATWQEMVQ